MNHSQSTVYVVDDDPSMRRAVARLCLSAGLEVKSFGSAQELLSTPPPGSPACLVLDLRMPGLSGLDLQTELIRRNIETPIVFITGHGDIPVGVRAMKAGAVDFLTKPFQHRNLLGVIQDALKKDLELATARKEREDVARRLATLTSREREVLGLLIKGKLNKQIAAELGAKEQTIKVHRRRIKDKMGSASIAELVQASVKAGFIPD